MAEILLSFPVDVIKYRNKSNLRKEGPVYFNLRFKIQSILVMGQWELPRVGHIIPVMRRQRVGAGSACCLQSGGPYLDSG